MIGASLVRRLPGVRHELALEQHAYGLFLLWLAFSGVLVMAAYLMWQAGAWHRLISADPTGITAAIVVMFVLASIWTGRRAWILGTQRIELDRRLQGLAQMSSLAVSVPPTWTDEYLVACSQPGCDRSIHVQVLGERTHGPHEMAWWINGIQLKLGLLGKVIGFSILALQLGQMESFDPSQSTELLKNLTGGLGIALLTTVTGLTGNILLGLQLMRLDRFADAIMTDTLTAEQQWRAAEMQDTSAAPGAQ
ncbi:MotA/TolQ/ExbB proton channel family protein [Hydrogenophaga sp. 5NK40-0174]